MFYNQEQLNMVLQECPVLDIAQKLKMVGKVLKLIPNLCLKIHNHRVGKGMEVMLLEGIQGKTPKI